MWIVEFKYCSIHSGRLLYSFDMFLLWGTVIAPSSWKREMKFPLIESSIFSVVFSWVELKKTDHLWLKWYQLHDRSDPNHYFGFIKTTPNQLLRFQVVTNRSQFWAQSMHAPTIILVITLTLILPMLIFQLPNLDPQPGEGYIRGGVSTSKIVTFY